MPARNKGLTRQFRLRFNTEEGSIITDTIRAHAEVGINISQNDAVRLLIRRGAVPLPESQAEARDRYAAHVDTCPACAIDPPAPGCPDGWWLTDMWGALVAAQNTTPPPTAPAPAPGLQQLPRGRMAAPGRRPIAVPQEG